MMGSSQSSRKVTIDNPNQDPNDMNNVIRVSDNVVQRLKNPHYLANAADAGGDTPDEKRFSAKSSVSPTHFYSVRDELKVHGLPYLTTKDIQEYVEAEVDQTNKYWEQRMEKLQEGHKRMEKKMIEEYTNAQVELEKMLPRMIPEDAEVPCTEVANLMHSCMKDHKNQPLKCLSIVEAYKGCIHEARKHVQQTGHEIPDQCRYFDIKQEAEKKLEERKEQEAKNKEEGTGNGNKKIC